ncbi:MAG TPA: methyltransferase [Thermoanaerobaculia bacterium]|nr:methyltransferase [Thermoanaerobaculia bacterium]
MSDQQAPPPHVHVFQMVMGLWHAQIAATAARFGVADLIARGVTRSDDIAREADADPRALYRFLRAAASAGLFIETEPGSFANTPVGDCLRSDSPTSLRDFVIAETAPGHWLPWGRLHDAIKSGHSVTTEALGVPAWDYYKANPEEGLAFARAMGNLSKIVAMDVVRLYDPSQFRRIVDVGGSQGVLLRALLDRAPNARGVLFDLPEVTASAPQDARVEIVSGSFFDTIPEGGDLYVLKSILHDWPDERCDAILANVHRAAAPGATVLLVETILTPPPQPSPVTFMDMNMLVMLDGRERTADEYGEMLRRAGFAMQRVIPTGGMFGLVEARRI